MGLGIFDTADNGLMVYIFGPEKSRPFTQSIHTLVGAGFVAGIVITMPFLPESEDITATVCPGQKMSEIRLEMPNSDMTVCTNIELLELKS
jgi:hypothetical protein